MLSFDWSLNIGTLIHGFSLVVAGIWAIMTIKAEVRLLAKDVHYLKEGQGLLNESFNQLGQILTQVAVQDNRINMLERAVEELRHGKGLITAD